MPRPFIYAALILIAMSLIPMALLIGAQQSDKQKPRIQIVPDMDQQQKYKTQSVNRFFRDGRAMRLPPAGTVARGYLDDDDLLYYGLDANGEFSSRFPLAVDEAVLVRGQQRYGVHCAVCHGLAGDGDGTVHRRAEALQEGTWTPPTDLASEVVVTRTHGHLYNTITNGIRNMPAYGPQITVTDRWAIVAYVRALQRARTATLDDVPEDERKLLQ
jgi:mono/diheme cytochrome c family protein